MPMAPRPHAWYSHPLFMTPKNPDGIRMLGTQTPAYRDHAHIIEQTKTWAAGLRLLQGRFRNDILDQAGIVCSRPPRDPGQSVAHSFHGLAIRLFDERSAFVGNERDEEEVLPLLTQTLATHLSVDQQIRTGRPHKSAEQNVRKLEERIDAVLDHCAAAALAPVYPFLFEDDELFSA